jgi:DNA-binding GntR family transcriptional regulator
MAPTSALLQPEADGTLSLSDRAYYGIRELIVSLELAPGSPVSERDLMERLRLGRTPVREALRTLAQEKLVEVYPRRGIVVSPVDVGDLGALSEARITLESFAARLAAERASVDDRDVARALLAEVSEAEDERDERALIELDQRIHRHVYRCAHNPVVESTLTTYYTLTLRIWFLALDRVARLDDAVIEHRELLEAICDGDAQRAENVMRRHIEGFERAIRAVL